MKSRVELHADNIVQRVENELKQVGELVPPNFKKIMRLWSIELLREVMDSILKDDARRLIPNPQRDGERFGN